MLSTSRLPLLLATTVVLATLANLAWHGMALNRSLALPVLDAEPAVPALAQHPPALPQLFAAQTAVVSDSSTLSGLVLQACLVADDPAYSRAIIQVQGSGTVHAVPGDMLTEGVELLSVQPDHVVLRQDQTEHTLSLRPADEA